MRDADGRQVMETVGAERDGGTRTKAEAELAERLVRVERKGYKRPTRGDVRPVRADVAGAGRETTRVEALDATTRRRQVGRLGERSSRRRSRRSGPGMWPSTSSDLLDDGYAPATVIGDLDVFFEVMKTAKREELIDMNPVEGVERPKIQRTKWRILEPVEVARVRKAFTEQQPRSRS